MEGLQVTVANEDWKLRGMQNCWHEFRVSSMLSEGETPKGGQVRNTSQFKHPNGANGMWTRAPGVRTP